MRCGWADEYGPYAIFLVVGGMAWAAWRREQGSLEDLVPMAPPTQRPPPPLSMREPPPTSTILPGIGPSPYERS